MYLYIYIYTYIHVYLHIYICMCVCVRVYRLEEEKQTFQIELDNLSAHAVSEKDLLQHTLLQQIQQLQHELATVLSLYTHSLACALFFSHQPTPPRPPPVLSFVLYLSMRTLLSLSPSPLALFPACLILVLAFSRVLRALHVFATTLSHTSRLLPAVSLSLALSLCSLRHSVTLSVALSCSCYRARTLSFLAHLYRYSFWLLCIPVPSLA